MLPGSPTTAATDTSPSSPCPSCGAPTCGRGEPWLQINATPSAPETVLLPALAPELARWREQGSGCIWFLRKDPGLRLRVRDLDIDAIRPTLSRLQSAGLISAWFPSVYEPEIHQFGGPAATHAVHTFFDADTRAILHASTLPTRRLTNPVLSLAILNDLFDRSLQVHEEIWDVWSNLQTMYGARGRGPEIPRLTLADLRRLASPGELELANIYEAANQRLATSIDSIWRQGALTCGRRSMLPYIAAFHWNRLGLDLDRMATLADAMATAWNPKRALRGAAMEARPA